MQKKQFISVGAYKLRNHHHDEIRRDDPPLDI